MSTCNGSSIDPTGRTCDMRIGNVFLLFNPESEKHERPLLTRLADTANEGLKLLNLDGKLIRLSIEYQASELTRELGTLFVFDLEGKRIPFQRDGPVLLKWKEQVRQGRFSLIHIGFTTSATQEFARLLDRDCDYPACNGRRDHSTPEHTLLHELVHAACPEYVLDNEWTDRKAAQVLLNRRQGQRGVV